MFHRFALISSSCLFMVSAVTVAAGGCGDDNGASTSSSSNSLDDDGNADDGTTDDGNAEDGGDGDGDSDCLVGSWATPSDCGGADLVLRLDELGRGDLTISDCNGLCDPIVFPFSYTVTDSTVFLAYSQPDDVDCGGTLYPVDQPTNDSFSFECSPQTLDTTTSLGLQTYTRLGGGTDVEPSTTCEMPCVKDEECSAGESCLESEDGDFYCWPSACTECFDEQRTCSWNQACELDECGPVNPDFSDTCGEPCASVADCNPGETCADTTAGSLCIAAACDGCFSQQLGCTSAPGTCDFVQCF